MTRSRTVRPAVRVALVAAATLFMLAVAGFGAPDAHAHDQILEQTPADGTHVALVPDEVSVLFSNDLIEVGAVMLVVDTNEVDWADGPVDLRGPISAQPLKPNMPDGAYTVRWRVVSSDGHPISGAYSFTAGDVTATDNPAPVAPQSPEPAEAEQPDTSGEAAPSVGPDAAVSTVSPDETNYSTAGADEPGGAIMRMLGLAGLGAVVGTAVYITFIFIRRRAS